MNKQKILEIADLIESQPDESFDMRTFGVLNSCGTCACIAGWVLIDDGYNLYPTGFSKAPTYEDALKHAPATMTGHVAQDILGLDDLTAISLFYPTTGSSITKHDAAAVLRNLVNTGAVKW